MAIFFKNIPWQGDPKNMAEWSQTDFTRCSKIYINYWQGSNKLFLGRVIPKTWQGGPKMILLDVARCCMILLFYKRYLCLKLDPYFHICKTSGFSIGNLRIIQSFLLWQGGSLIGRVDQGSSQNFVESTLGRVPPKKAWQGKGPLPNY